MRRRVFRHNLNIVRICFCFLLRQSASGHHHGHIEGALHADRAGNTFPNNIESCAVRRSCNDDRKTTLNCNAALKRQQLHGNLALVMIHRNNAVEMLTLQEDGVAREWSLYIDAFRLSFLDGWSDEVNFLSTEVSIFAVVWIQGTDAQARRLDTGFPSIFMSVSRSETSVAAYIP